MGIRLVASIGSLCFLVSCLPETDPFLLAPTARCTPYYPGCEPDPNPDEPARFPFPSMGQPVKLPVCCKGELALADLIDIALYNSTDTQKTWAAARQAAAQYGESRSDYYPEIGFQGIASELRQADPFGTNRVITQTVSTYYPRFNISWLLVDMGTRRAKAIAFREALLSANWDHNREIQTVMQEVMVDYFDLVAKQGLVKASEADLADAEVNLDATLTKHLAGIADIADVSQARTVVAQKELQLLSNLEDLEKSEGELTAALGIPSTEPLCVQQLPSEIQVPSLCESVDALLAQAYSVRPDLFAAWAKVRSQKASINQVFADMLPSLKFDGYVGRTYFLRGESDNFDYFARLTLDIPIFRGFSRWNRVKEAKAELEMAKAELRSLEIAISREVVVGYKTFKLSGEKVIAGVEYVDAAETSYQATLGQYKVGTTDFVTLANAFSELADARAALVLARQDLFTSLAQLAYATGSLEPSQQATSWRSRICP